MSHFPFAEVAENYHNCRMSEKTANPLEQFVLLAKTAKVNLWISLEFSNSSRVPLPWSWSSRPWRLPVSLSLGSCLICQMSRLPFSISSSPILHPIMYKFHFFPRIWRMGPTPLTLLSSTLLLMETTDPWWTTRQTFLSWRRWWSESFGCSRW